MNLTPEQLELLLYLLGALAIGFLFGYLLSRSYSREAYEVELEEFSELLDTRDREIESASAQYGQLKQHMVVQSDEIKMKNQQIEDAKDAVSNVEHNTKLLNDEKIELESLLLQKDMKISELNEEVSFSRNELQDGQNLLNEYKELNNNHDEKLLTANNEIEQNAKLSHALIKKSEEQLLKVKELEEQKVILNNKVQTLTKNSQERNVAIVELEKQSVALSELKLENQSLNEKLTNASKSLVESKAQVSKLEIESSGAHRQDEDFNTLQQKLEATKNEITQKDTNISNLKQTIASLETETQNIQNKLTNSDILNKELQNVKADLERKKDILKSTEDKLNLSQQENKRIDRQLQNNIANERAISQLSGNDVKNEGWGFTKIVKDVLGNIKQKKDS